MRAEKGLLLRRRQVGISGSAARRAVLVRVALGATVLAALAGLAAAQSNATTAPSPDPYASPNAGATSGGSSSPKPDPAPSGNRSGVSQTTQPRTAVTAPQPASTPQPSSNPAPAQPSYATTPAVTTPNPTTAEEATPKPAKKLRAKIRRRVTPAAPKRPHTTGSQPKAKTGAAIKTVRERAGAAASAVAARAASTSGTPMLLGALALLALVVASGGLLHLLSRSAGWRRA